MGNRGGLYLWHGNGGTVGREDCNSKGKSMLERGLMGQIVFFCLAWMKIEEVKIIKIVNLGEKL